MLSVFHEIAFIESGIIAGDVDSLLIAPFQPTTRSAILTIDHVASYLPT